MGFKRKRPRYLKDLDGFLLDDAKTKTVTDYVMQLLIAINPDNASEADRQILRIITKREWITKEEMRLWKKIKKNLKL